MADELLAECTKMCADARYGYCVPDCPTYYRHVSALLADRQELAAAVVALAERCELLASQLPAEAPKELES
jgi:hypothetical protein